MFSYHLPKPSTTSLCLCVCGFFFVACDCYSQGTVVPPGHNPADPLPCDDEGKCTCLRNVIGDKCDSCRDTYWNVGSGFGCEECMCDPTGSLNNSCDVTTGQCPCKPGVTGRTCDQCQADHYSFSSQGCLCEFLLLFPRVWKVFSESGIWFDLIQQTPNFLTGCGIRDLAAIREADFAKIVVRDAVLGKKTVFGIELSEIRHAGL